jgi:uncharacterized protein (DUF779 family)
MQGSDDSPGRRLVVTDLARKVMARQCREQGRQAVVLCWPGGATCLPLALHVPGAYDVVLGHIARCPIYVDVRQVGWSAAKQAVLDVAEAPRASRRPVLRLRPVDQVMSHLGTVQR